MQPEDARGMARAATALNSQLLLQTRFFRGGGGGRTIQHGSADGRDHWTHDAGERGRDGERERERTGSARSRELTLLT